jgi:hypothetical protein
MFNSESRGFFRSSAFFFLIVFVFAILAGYFTLFKVFPFFQNISEESSKQRLETVVLNEAVIENVGLIRGGDYVIYRVVDEDEKFYVIVPSNRRSTPTPAIVYVD